MGESQRALYGGAEEVVDTGTAGLIEEEAPPGYWPGSHAGDSSGTRAHEDNALSHIDDPGAHSWSVGRKANFFCSSYIVRQQGDELFNGFFFYKHIYHLSFSSVLW